MNIYSAEQFYQADQVTIQNLGLKSIDLMERAANQLYQWLHQRLQGAQVPIRIFCGIGNNGGDGLALGRMLVQSGYNVQIYIANFSEHRSDDFLTNYNRFKDATKDWPVLMSSEHDFPEIQQEDIIVDCLFGIGLNRAPEGWVKMLIQHLIPGKILSQHQYCIGQSIEMLTLFFNSCNIPNSCESRCNIRLIF